MRSRQQPWQLHPAVMCQARCAISLETIRIPKNVSGGKPGFAIKSLIAMDKLPKSAAGAFIFTLLTGKALDCVEHLPPEAYQKEGGDELLLQILDRRFPEKDKTDELGEMMHEIFALKTQSGETVKGWRCSIV